jgi:hypothetical protein
MVLVQQLAVDRAVAVDQMQAVMLAGLVHLVRDTLAAQAAMQSLLLIREAAVVLEV